MGLAGKPLDVVEDVQLSGVSRLGLAGPLFQAQVAG